MKSIHTTAFFLAIAASLALSCACDPKDEAPPVAPVAPVVAAPSHQPTAERVKLRSQERWDNAVKKEWIAVYDFGAPELKREMALSAFLVNMQMHIYQNMRVVEVLGVQDNNAYVHARGLWTPTGPKFAKVKLEPGQTLTQEVDVYETWRFTDGDWCYVRAERDTDFYEAHPDLLKADKGPEDAAK